MTGVVSQGWTIGVGDAASPEVFTTIPGATDIDGPSWEKAVIDMSALEDAIGSFEPGKPKVQPVSFTLNFDPDLVSHQNLEADSQARTKRNYRITRTDTSPSTTQTFQAFVTSFGVTVSDDEKVPAAIVLQPTGIVTLA